MITEDTVVATADGLSVADLEGEAVILSSRTSAYFGLNEVGARAFQLAQQARSVRDIVGVMIHEYGASREQLTEDLVGFFRKMEEANLIVIGRTAQREG